jgi:EEF1A N-terminal glycine/lysine methyltransferase
LSDDPYSRPNGSAQFLGLPSNVGHGSTPGSPNNNAVANGNQGGSNNVTYHGVCLTVWSHADAERSAAIRRTLEAARSRKESAQSVLASRLKSLRGEAGGVIGSRPNSSDPTFQARKRSKKSARGPWTDVETDGETEGEGAISESDYEVASTVNGHGPGESTLFLPGDTVFWLPYALSK